MAVPLPRQYAAVRWAAIGYVENVRWQCHPLRHRPSGWSPTIIVRGHGAISARDEIETFQPEDVIDPDRPRICMEARMTSRNGSQPLSISAAGLVPARPHACPCVLSWPCALLARSAESQR
jgi:hypothetical protein